MNKILETQKQVRESFEGYPDLKTYLDTTKEIEKVDVLPSDDISTEKMYLLSTNDSINVWTGTVWKSYGGSTGISNLNSFTTDDLTESSTKKYISTTEKTKIAGISTNANKTESSSTNGNIKIDSVETNVYTHPSGTNPHNTTKADVGLGNVNNTSDVNKPISTSVQSALDNKVNNSTGKSLINDTEITRLAGVSNYDHTNVDTHMANSTIHVTSTDKSNWNSSSTNSIISAGGNYDGSTPNDTAFTTAKASGKVFFPQNGTNTAIYYFTSTPNMDGIIISADKGVKLSFPTCNSLSFKNAIFQNDIDTISRDRDNTGHQLINNYSKSLYNISCGSDLTGHVKPIKVATANINKILCSTTSTTITGLADLDIRKSSSYPDYYYVYPTGRTNDPNTFIATTVAVSDSDMITSAFNAFVVETDATSRAGAIAINTTADKFIFFSLDISKKLYIGYNNVGTWTETNVDLSIYTNRCL